MNLGIDFMLQSIVPKDVIIFTNPSFSSPDPHLYICVGRQNNHYQFVLASTRQAEVARRVAVRGQHQLTIVQIDPAPACPLHQQSWIDCNNIYNYTHAELKALVGDTLQRVQNRMPDNYHEAIVNGICISEITEQTFIDYLNAT
jgi:hypothetical protein